MAQSVSSLMSSVPHTLLVGSLLQWQYQFIILIANHLQTLGQKSQRIQSQKLVITPVSIALRQLPWLSPVHLCNPQTFSSQLYLYGRVSVTSCSFTPTKEETLLIVGFQLEHFQSNRCYSISINLSNFPILSWKDNVFTFLFCSHHSMYRLRFFGLQARRIHSVWFK